MLKQLNNYISKKSMEVKIFQNLDNINKCEEALKGRITREERKLLKDSIKLCKRTNKYLEKKINEI